MFTEAAQGQLHFSKINWLKVNVKLITIAKKVLVLLLYLVLFLFKKKDLNSLLVLTYHRISEISDFEDSLKVSRAMFERQILYLKEHYHFISGEQLADIVKHKKEIPEKSCLITFDDGWADNYTNAFPILCKYNVPAILFICTDYIGTHAAFWHERLSDILKGDAVQRAIVQKTAYRWPQGIGETIDKIIRLPRYKRQQVINSLIEDMKSLGPHDIERILNDLEGIVDSNQRKKQPSMLSWSQVKEMSHKNICIGSHTKSHAILTRLNEGDIDEEIQGAKKIIERNLSRQVHFLAYPNGNFNESVVKATRKADYLAAFTCIHGVNHHGDDPFIFKRINIKEYTSSGLTRRFSKWYFSIELSEIRSLLIQAKQVLYNLIRSEGERRKDTNAI